MKRFATVLLCMAFVFGGIAGCATSHKAPEAPATVISDSQPTDVLTFEDVRFEKSDQKVPVKGCKGNDYQEYYYVAVATLSDGTETDLNLVVVYDRDCGDYGAFYYTNFGPEHAFKAASLDEARDIVLKAIKGKPVK